MVLQKMKIHCLFEQSGTFKNQFKAKGYDAFDYDIADDYGQTDFKIDLFDEIMKASTNSPSVFDSFSKDDIVFAFFPCIRFSEQSILTIKCTGSQYQNWDVGLKMLQSSAEERRRSDLYYYFCSLFWIAYKKNLRLIVENPYSTQSYLVRYFPLEPTLIDWNRRKRGDYFQKPTQYWFYNIEPKTKVILFEPEEMPLPYKAVQYCSRKHRSEISPTYAKRFIEEFVI